MSRSCGGRLEPGSGRVAVGELAMYRCNYFVGFTTLNGSFVLTADP